MNKSILKISNLKKNYHTDNSEIVALNNISFDILENEFISIVGPSGCGKSTILSILANLESKSSGSFKFSKPVKIGYMLQNDSLFSWRTVLDNCLVGLEISGNLNEETKNYVVSLLKNYGLEEFMHQYPSSLSGGMRQRVLRIRYTHK